MSSRALRLLKLGMLVLFSFQSTGCKQETPAAEDTTPPAPVKWMEARQLFISGWTEVLGNTQPLPDRAARVTAAVEGDVVSIGDGAGKPISEGQRVKKGDIIVRLYDQIARNNREKAVAELEVLKQQEDQAKLHVKEAEVEVRRLQELIRRGNLASPVDLEKAELAVEDAKSKVKGAGLSVKAAEKQIKVLDEQLELYKLRAPISGRLGRILVVPGQTLAIGTAAAEITDFDDEIDLLCFVPPSIRNQLRDGQQVQVGTVEEVAGGSAKSESDSATRGKGSGRSAGKIVYIADQAEVDTGNFAIKARFRNAALRLPGYITLRAQVLTTPGRAALTLPESALMEDQDPPAVIVVEDEKQEKTKEGKDMQTGKARKLQVKVGVRDRVLHLVEILALDDPEKKWHGSLDSAKFVIEKGHGLKTDDPIRLEEEDEDEAPPAKEKD
jgi:membrane fusion protein, multidrug efflux system